MFYALFIPLIGLIFFGFYGLKSNGYENFLLQPDQKQVIESLKRNRVGDCGNSVAECIGDAHSRREDTILLLGDSNAYHFSNSLRNVADKRKMHFLSLTKSGCLPLGEFHLLSQPPAWNKRCIEHNSEIIQALNLSERKFKTVVVSAAWLLYLNGTSLHQDLSLKSQLPPLNPKSLSVDGKSELLGDHKIKIFEDYLNNVLSILKSASQQIIFVGPLPYAITDFKSKVGIFNPKSLPSSSFKAEAEDFDMILQKVKKVTPFEYINLFAEMCDAQFCMLTKRGLFVYGDHYHFSDFGQKAIMEPFFDKIVLE